MTRASSPPATRAPVNRNSQVLMPPARTAHPRLLNYLHIHASAVYGSLVWDGQVCEHEVLARPLLRSPTARSMVRAVRGGNGMTAGGGGEM